MDGNGCKWMLMDLTGLCTSTYSQIRLKHGRPMGDPMELWRLIPRTRGHIPSWLGLEATHWDEAPNNFFFPLKVFLQMQTMVCVFFLGGEWSSVLPKRICFQPWSIPNTNDYGDRDFPFIVNANWLLPERISKNVVLDRDQKRISGGEYTLISNVANPTEDRVERKSPLRRHRYISEFLGTWDFKYVASISSRWQCISVWHPKSFRVILDVKIWKAPDFCFHWYVGNFKIQFKQIVYLIYMWCSPQWGLSENRMPLKLMVQLSMNWGNSKLPFSRTHHIIVIYPSPFHKKGLKHHWAPSKPLYSWSMLVV